MLIDFLFTESVLVLNKDTSNYDFFNKDHSFTGDLDIANDELIFIYNGSAYEINYTEYKDKIQIVSTFRKNYGIVSVDYFSSN